MNGIIKTLKTLLIVTILGTTQVVKADCISDCRKALDAADRVIQDLKDEISVRKQLEETQATEIANLNVQLNDKNQELSSLMHNPWFMVTVGIVVGGATVLYLSR